MEACVHALTVLPEAQEMAWKSEEEGKQEVKLLQYWTSLNIEVTRNRLANTPFFFVAFS